MNDRTGQVIDERYRIEELLREGELLRVYRAQHVVLARPLEVHVIRAELAEDGQVGAFFRQATTAMAQVDEYFATARGAANAEGRDVLAHIVSLSDFGTLPEGPGYAITEHVDGPSLEAVLEAEGRQPSERIVHLGRQLCEALHEMHRAGTVHRNLEPANIWLVEHRGQPDFAKLFDVESAMKAHWSSISPLFGDLNVDVSPLYLAPEQCEDGPLDARTDIYALGAILYEMATGRPPFDAETWEDVAEQHRNQPPQRPTELEPSLSQDLEAILLRALAKHPEDRYATMQEMQLALEGARNAT